MKAKYKNFYLSSRFVGIKSAPYDKNNTSHIIVVITDMNTGRWSTFDCWKSKNDREDFNNARELLEAFMLYLDDCNISTNNTLDKYALMSGFYFDNPVEHVKARRCYKVSKNEARKIKKRFKIYDFDLVSLVADLENKYNFL